MNSKITGRHGAVVLGALLLALSLCLGSLLIFLGENLARAASTDPLPAADEKRGLRYGGLERPREGRCKQTFKLVKRDRCSHGPDPVPENVDISRDRPPVETASAAAPEAGSEAGTAPATGGSIACEGDGVSGKRFQAIYARASGQPDRYSTYAASIAQWAGAADRVFVNSAAQTGGSRRMRWVTDPACNLSVLNVTLSSTGDDNFDNTIDELWSRGYNRTDRIYVIWMDANVYCGIGTVNLDDSAGPRNASNTGPAYARTDAGCWGLQHSIEAHEVMHTLGGVQRSAPHSTYRLNPNAPGTFHCFDESDRMCYKDADGVNLLSACNDLLNEALFDCQSDDYFHTAPPPGHYLANYWNPANSDFLIQAARPLSKYTPLPPARILDTRIGTGGISGTVGPGKSINVKVTGVGGVPSSGVSAVMLNVAVTQPSAASYLTVYPAGISPPIASNLNFSAGQTTSNLVVGKVGTNGQVSLLNNSGSVHLVIDVQGYYSDSSTAASGSTAASSPSSTAESTPETSNGTGTDAGPQGETTNPPPDGSTGSDFRPGVDLDIRATPPGPTGPLGASVNLPLPVDPSGR